jgi:nucleoside-diphosphate-sugar epimerase
MRILVTGATGHVGSERTFEEWAREHASELG